MSIRVRIRDWLNRPSKAELAHSAAKADAEWRARVDSEILAISAEIGLLKALGALSPTVAAEPSRSAPKSASTGEPQP